MTSQHLTARVIKASAGSGKTFQLTNHYLRLIIEGVEPKSILAATFTRKAAAEIRQRVLERLIKGAQGAAQCRSLAEELELPGLTVATLQAVLRRVVGSLGELEISTLDAFFIKLCAGFSSELGLLPEWKLVEGKDVTDLHRQTLQKLFQLLAAEDMRILMNAVNQGQVRSSVAKQLLQKINSYHSIFTQTERSAWLCKARPNEILGSQFFRAFKQEVGEAPVLLTKQGQPNKSYEKSRQGLMAIIASEDSEAIIKHSLLQKFLAQDLFYNGSPLPTELLRLLETNLPHLVGDLRAKNNQEVAAWHLLLGHYDHQLQLLKRQLDSYSYDDIKLFFSGALAEWGLNQIYYRIDSQIKHVLLDEFQDTSLKEWRVLRPLVEEVLSKSSQEHTFFCVGDVKQAIYGWRGGVAQIFDEITKAWKHVYQEPLTVSRRSSPVIIELVNKLFSQFNDLKLLDPYPDVRERWRTAFEVHQTVCQSLTGYAEILEYQEDKTGVPQLVSLEQKIREILSANPTASIAVLLRDNKNAARIVRHLRVHLPEFSLSDEGGNALRHSPGVGIIFSLLQFIDHPGDSISVFHLKNSPLASQIGIDSVSTPGQAEECALHLRVKLLERGLCAFIAEYCGHLFDHLRLADRKRLEQLQLLAYQYSDRNISRPAEFIAWAELCKIDSSEDAQIRVMTIHSSKGLEFDAVFLPGLNFKLASTYSGLDILRSDPLAPAEFVVRRRNKLVRAAVPEFQQAYHCQAANEISEALCVLYVALTRAKQALYISIPRLKTDSTSMTSAALIKQALQLEGSDDGPGLLFQSGSAEWYFKVPTEPEQQSTQQLNPAQPFELIAHKSARRRGQIVQAASAVAHPYVLSLEQAIRSKSPSSFVRGRELHLLLQQIEWLPAGLDNVPRELSDLLQQPNLKRLLSLDTYLAQGLRIEAVKRELRILTRYADSIISGAIDRLVTGRATDGSVYVEVIDFKSDRFNFSDANLLKLMVDNYRSQLEIYGKAAAELMKIDPREVKKTLAFVSGDVIINL